LVAEVDNSNARIEAVVVESQATELLAMDGGSMAVLMSATSAPGSMRSAPPKPRSWM